MPDFGVTPEGFVLKRLADILQDYVTVMNAIEDPVTGETLILDLADENDPLVQMVHATADALSVDWEELQLAYNQFDPLKATGAGLTGTVQLNGLRRKAGQASTAAIALTGTPNLLIPAGKQITDTNDTFVWELPQVVLDGAGAAVAIATCTTKGSNEALISTLVKILTPLAGWDTVTNTAVAIQGSLEETDEALRNRQQNSTAATGESVIDSLFGALSQLDDVEFVRAYQNITLVVDSRGVPGKTVACVVVGGDDNEISAAIFEKLALGVGTFGTTAVVETDAQGVSYPISFSRPDEIDIFVKVEVTVVDASLWPTDGAAQIKSAILAWATGNIAALGITTGYDNDGYVPGDTVFASELYVPVNSVRGTQITSILVGIVAPATDLSVPTDWDEIASFDSANIDVVVS